MFRKIVSNLAFSPALVGQLSFYAKRLKKEELTRRLGLIFTVLALVVQSLAVFSPPEAVNAAHPSDFVSGGVGSIQQYLGHYDQNTNNIRDLYNTLGITRAEIANTSPQQVNSRRDGVISWGLTSRFSQAAGENPYTVQTASGNMRTFYNRPLSLWDTGANVSRGSTYTVFAGYSAKVGWFAIMMACGNLITKTVPPPPQCPPNTVGTYPNCAAPCPHPGKSHLAAGDPGCKPDPVVQCTSLTINKLNGSYALKGTATATNATIQSYTYTIKRDGSVVETKTNPSSSPTDTYTFATKDEGTYEVNLTVKTSIGDKTSPNCVKKFSIPPPEKCPQNPSLSVDDPNCQPCPENNTVWIKDESCKTIIMTKSARNLTQNLDARSSVARTTDKVTYTITAENTKTIKDEYVFNEKLDDVLEYATLVDAGGAKFDEATKTLTWPSTTLEAKQKQSRTFAVQLLPSIPLTNTGTSFASSYDCKMTNTFGNQIDIMVDCPPEKVIIEQTVSELPQTGPRENMIFAGILLSIVIFFYARSRQLGKEVRLIRRNVTTGVF